MTNTQNPLQDLDKLLLSDLAPLPLILRGCYLYLLQFYKNTYKITHKDSLVARMLGVHPNAWTKLKDQLIDFGFLIKKEDGLYPLHYSNIGSIPEVTPHDTPMVTPPYTIEVTPHDTPPVVCDNPLILSSLNNPSYTSSRITPSDQFLKIDFKEKIKKEKKIRKKPDFENPDDDANFLEFWAAYPPNKHEDRPRTFLEWKKITKKQGVNHEELIGAAKNYAAKFIGEANPMPNAAHNWLVRGSWRDYTDAKIRSRPPAPAQLSTAQLVAIAAAEEQQNRGYDPDFEGLRSVN